MHGLLPFACIMGAIACTVFLKISGGVVTTLPAKWYLPLLLKAYRIVTLLSSIIIKPMSASSKMYQMLRPTLSYSAVR
jgi:hypothetical protein